MSKVVVVKSQDRELRQPLTRAEYNLFLTAGLRALTGEPNAVAALRKLLPPGVVGMKTNCLAGKANSTPVALTEALADMLIKTDRDANDIVVWERTSRELAEAGYELNAASTAIRCLGTDANGVGYSDQFYSYGEVNSLVSRIITRVVDFNINLPVLKDHSIAGLSAGLKNMYGAIHNPNKYHGDNCNPFCAHVANLTPIRLKNRLTIIDAVRVQYNGGPAYVGSYLHYYGGLVIATDPVAADRVGLEILEYIRATNNHPPLAQVERPVQYLKTAAEIGLGIAELDDIDLEVLDIDVTGNAKEGTLF
ncbi:MAG: DUF362 domain-containing protein [candidate division Zixibacteria bacterium]|nr:DUF362 domain-containing protein [candidate division Zixibacteria bacterium]